MALEVSDVLNKNAESHSFVAIDHSQLDLLALI